MPGKNFFDEFYTETMTEMAGNFFSRRKEMEARLEGFQRLAGEVRAGAVKALRHWRTLFMLLLDGDGLVDLLRDFGLETGGLPALAEAAGDPWRFKSLFAFTDEGRYVKSVRYVYEAVRAATDDYNDGAYGTDPKNPRKKVLLPNYKSLKDMAARINDEVDSVNRSQTPSTVLAYCKGFDVREGEKEKSLGGLAGEDVSRIDRELAFAPVDFKALDLPGLPALPPLEDIRDRLDRLGESVYASRPEEAMRVLRFVTAG